ncbi:geranylgeranyl reductase family protein [Sorangium sp. So ce375]|uniref:NAD(P)/FAD-dependent oxidoreductase n=1 Tax=Sorangium sp. So ce375 TaxID=3133306 RepID=UPI003F5C98F9
MTVYDVVIAGAGPAGSALAVELASEGYSVLLCDAARFPRDKVCGDYVSPRGLARLAALGCSEAIGRLECTPIRKSRLYLNRDHLVSGVLPRVAGLPAHGHAIPRKELDDILFRRAIRAGAVVRESCRVTGFEATARGVHVSATHEGKACRIEGRLVVGADGATSAVANAAGLRMNDPRYTLASIRAYAHGLTLDHTLMYFDEKYFPGYGWVFPVRPGLCNIGVGMVSEPLVRSGLKLGDFYAKLTRLVHHLAGAKGARVEIGPQRGWPIRSYGGATENHFERGLLIGEAGCFVDPINGEGIPLALSSAHVAARTVRAAFQEGRFGKGFLARYEADFRARFDPDLGISDLAVTMIRNRHLLPVWLAIFRTMSLAAQKDARYAEVTGGILGGVIPAREAITPEMFVRALVHGPGFWREALGAGAPGGLSGWFAGGAALLGFQSSLARAIKDDGAWWYGWVKEVQAKQNKLGLAVLRGLSFGGP